MKNAVALGWLLAPLALAKAVHNVYPVAQRDAAALQARNSKSQGSASLLDSLLSGSGTDVIIIWANAGGGSTTTTVNQVQTVTATVTAAATVTATAAAAADTTASATNATSVSVVAGAAIATHSVTVGGSAGLVYEPDTITANVGDMVVFTFLSQNHTVTQSAFATPCELLAGGMDSGFQANINNSVSPAPQVAMQVMVSTPLWFYCKQTGHCGKGMVFSINPTANKTQALFQQMAIAQNGTGTDSTITGGTTSSVSSAATTTTASTVSLDTAATATTAAATGVVTGVGSTNADGSCACVVQCAAGSFAVSGAFGGVAGTLSNVVALR